MRILIGAVLCAVICVSSITFTTASIKHALTNTAAELNGGDITITADEPIQTDILRIAHEHRLNTTETVSFYSMLSTNAELALTSIKAVTTNYPLRGQLRIRTAVDNPDVATKQIPNSGTIWVEARILNMLNVKLGDVINIGSSALKITAILVVEPDKIADGLTFAPRAIINVQDLTSINVLLPGSRITYRLLMAGNPENVIAFQDEIANQLPVDYKLQLPDSSNSAAVRNLLQSEKFLILALLVNIIFAAIAIGIAAQQYILAHIKEIAIMRCMGAHARQIIWLYAKNLSTISILLGVVGTIVGFIIQQVIAAILQRYLAIQLPLPGWQPFILGIISAFGLVVGVALPALLSLVAISPMQILRNLHVRPNRNSYFGYIFILLAFLGLLLWQVRDLQLFATIIGSTLLVLILGYVIVYFLFNSINTASTYLPIAIRLGVRNIYYNFTNNIVLVLAFALVICVALLLFIIRNDLVSNWQVQMPQQTPNYFAINIPSDRAAAMSEFLESHNIKSTEFYPIVRGTLVKINQEAVNIQQDTSEKRTGINRPLNLTWTQSLPVDNKILSGKWFDSKNAIQPEISIEKTIAERLNVKIGDELTFNILTQEIDAKVTSIRSVEWDSFNPNFYVIYSPGTLDGFAYSYMASLLVAASQESLMLDLTHTFPEISLLSISELLSQAKQLLNLLAFVVGYIWIFTMLAGVMLLLAVILSSIKARIFQNNLMRILGASRQQLQRIMVIEFLVIGGLAGALGAAIALVAARFVTLNIMQSSYPMNWYIVVLGCAAGAIIMVCGGLVATFKALRETPIQLSRNLN